MNKQHKGMRPQDVIILIKLALSNREWSAKELGQSLGLSKSEICNSLERSMQAGLIDDSKRLVKRRRLVELLQYGFGYVFPANLTSSTRGIPTALSVKPLVDKIMSDESFVWPNEEGDMVGIGILPLCRTVPQAVKHDEKLHVVLALVDILRLEGSRVRERNLAKELLEDVLLNRNELVLQA